MKYIFAVLGLLISFGAMADTRLEKDNDYCHFPYDKNDTDNEYESYCEVSILSITGPGVVAAWAKVTYEGVPELFAPRENTYFDDLDTPQEEACTIRDENGNETTRRQWAVRITVDCPDGRGGGIGACTVTYENICGYGRLDVPPA